MHKLIILLLAAIIAKCAAEPKPKPGQAFVLPASAALTEPALYPAAAAYSAYSAPLVATGFYNAPLNAAFTSQRLDIYNNYNSAVLPAPYAYAAPASLVAGPPITFSRPLVNAPLAPARFVAPAPPVATPVVGPARLVGPAIPAPAVAAAVAPAKLVTPAVPVSAVPARYAVPSSAVPARYAIPAVAAPLTPARYVAPAVASANLVSPAAPLPLAPARYAAAAPAVAASVFF